MAKCAFCVRKKGKRICPALGAAICGECCGTKRQKEIVCPVNCSFLGMAKEFAGGRQDAARLRSFEQEMKSIIGNEEPVEDVLQNIEYVIHKIYRDSGSITDRHARVALEYLFEEGKRQLGLPAKVPTDLSPNVRAIVEGIEDVLELRGSLSGNREDSTTKLKCIYRVLDSVRTHYHPRDDCSYLRFIGCFLL